MAKQEQLGSYAFLGGAAIAIIAGVLSGLGQSGMLGGIEAWIPLALVALGVVVGIMNIRDKDITSFLIASIALLGLAGTAGGLSVVDKVASPLGAILIGIVQNIAIFVAPAALIVALKMIKDLAAEQTM